MAKDTIEQLQEEIERLKLEKEELTQTAAAARQEAETIAQAAATAAARGGKISMPVPGSVEVSYKNAMGKETKRKVEFKDGRQVVILPAIPACGNMSGMYVSSESLMLIANGKPAKPEHVQRHSILEKIDQALALEILTHFAAIQAGFLK